MNEPLVSSDALGLHRDALVWDMTLPIITPGSPQRKQPLFRRAAAAGFDYISITLAVDLYDFRAAATELARHRSFVADHSDVAVLADSTAAISDGHPAAPRGPHRPRRRPCRPRTCRARPGLRL